jgi:hypothetical protein
MIDISPNKIIIGGTNLLDDIPKIKSDSKVFRHVGSIVSSQSILLSKDSGKTKYTNYGTRSNPNPLGEIYSLKLTVTAGSGSFIPVLINKTIPLSSGLVYNYHSDFITGQGEIVSEYDILTYKYHNTKQSPNPGILEIAVTGCATPRFANGVFGEWENFETKYPSKSISFTYTVDVYTFN